MARQSGKVSVIIGVLAFCLTFGASYALMANDPMSRLSGAIALLQSGQSQAALSEFKALSKKRMAPADYWVATIYLKGMGVPKDVKTAIGWLHRSARQDYTPAMLVLGDLHLKGLDGQVREGLAFGWYQKAAKAGDIFALMQVGKMYTQGQGVPKNPIVGMKYVRRAAEMNSPQAQHILGLAYLRGVGVTPDKAQAQYWLEQALINGFEAARPDYEALRAP